MKDSTHVWSPTLLGRTREISVSQFRVDLPNSFFLKKLFLIPIFNTEGFTALKIWRARGLLSQCLQFFTEWQTEKLPGVSDTRAMTKTTRWKGWMWSWAIRSVCPVRVTPFPHPSSAGTKMGRNWSSRMECSFSRVGWPFVWSVAEPAVRFLLKVAYLFRRTGATNCSSAERRCWKVHVSGC